jgi:putative membrane protein insertion efficiency factor
VNRGVETTPTGRPHEAAMDSVSVLDAARRAPRLMGQALIRLYRYTLSPLVGFECRHLPTCSHYAEEAIGRFGLWQGGWMTLARLLRCHPFGTSGLDVVPTTLPARSHWYLPWRYGRWRGTLSELPNDTPRP